MQETLSLPVCVRTWEREGVEDRYARETVEDSSQAWEEVCPDMQELSDGLGPHPSSLSNQFFPPFILITDARFF